MTHVHRIVLALCALFLGIDPLGARADVATFDDSTGNHLWTTAQNWQANVVPGTTDRVVIPSGLICWLGSSVTVDTLDVQGNLHVAESCTLTLTNSNDNIAGTPDNSVIAGTLSLETSTLPNPYGGELSFTSAAHTLTGTGAIQGGRGSLISVVGYIRLTSQLNTATKGIRGSGMTMDGIASMSPTPPSFENKGIVAAVNGNVLTMGASLALFDVSTAQWNTENSSANTTLQFDRASELNGNFNGKCNVGKFVFTETVTTCGTFTRNGAAVTVSSGKTFEYYSWAVGTPSTCSNPGSISGSPSCSPTFNGYVVTAGTYSGCSCND